MFSARQFRSLFLSSVSVQTKFYFRSVNMNISRVQSTHMAEIIMTQQR